MKSDGIDKDALKPHIDELLALKAQLPPDENENAEKPKQKKKKQPQQKQKQKKQAPTKKVEEISF